MNPCQRFFSFSPVHRLFLIGCLLTLLVPTVAAAWGDEAVFFFDRDASGHYASDYRWLNSVPELVPAYLVLVDPTALGGVGGWEGRLTIDGPATMTSATIEGDNVLNLLQPPNYMVGIGGSPLPPAPQTLLATFEFFVTGDEAVSIALEPLFYASIPDNICYLNGDGSGQLLPMRQPESWINYCEPECPLLSTLISYPPLELGEEETAWVTILNYNFETCGSPVLDVSLQGYPELDTDDFHLTEISGVVDYPFRILQIPVVYAPTEPGYHQALVRLGDECDAVWLEGICRDPVVGEDRVGVFFDIRGTEYQTTADAGTIVKAYLTILNPSSEEGVAGWEGCVEVVGDAEIVSWYLNGNPTNELVEPCFRVDLEWPTATTAWFGSATVAMFEILLHSDDEVEIALRPTPDATLPGQMSWTHDSTVEPVVRPLASHFDQPIVAWINGEPVAVIAGRPQARADGRRVTLSWPMPAGHFDGYHVYRRTGDAEAEKLTASPLPITERSITYVDEPSRVTFGTTLYYSYGLLDAGVEVARSPEAEVQLNNLPAAQSRLLASVPNPFNPQTEITFELRNAGRARVTIHDVSGRLVRTLVDAEFEAGPHGRTWFGEDDQGRRAPSGVYTIRLETDGRVDQGKVMLLK